MVFGSLGFSNISPPETVGYPWLSHDLDVASQGLYSNDQTWRAWASLVEIYSWENHLEMTYFPAKFDSGKKATHKSPN